MRSCRVRPEGSRGRSRDGRGGRGAAHLRRATGRLHAALRHGTGGPRPGRAGRSTRSRRLFRHDRFVRDHGCIGRRRHGGRAPRARPQARAQRRTEGASTGPRRPSMDRGLPPGSTRGVGPQSPQHPDDLRDRRARGHEVHRSRVRRRPDAARADEAGTDPRTRGGRHRIADRRRLGSGARRRRGTPRHQARERDAARRRPGENPGLRHRHEDQAQTFHPLPPDPRHPQSR